MAKSSSQTWSQGHNKQGQGLDLQGQGQGLGLQGQGQGLDLQGQGLERETCQVSYTLQIRQKFRILAGFQKMARFQMQPYIFL